MLFEGFMECLELQLAFSELECIAFYIQEGDRSFDDYTCQHRLVELYINCATGKREKLDWQWLHDEGKLCELDYSRFEDQLIDVGIDARKIYAEMKEDREKFIERIRGKRNS